jgi:hypothetical protein
MPRPVRTKTTPEREGFIHWKDVKPRKHPFNENATPGNVQDTSMQLMEPLIEPMQTDPMQQTDPTQPTITNTPPKNTLLESSQLPHGLVRTSPIKNPNDPAYKIWLIWKNNDWEPFPRSINATLERCWRSPSKKQDACQIKTPEGLKMWVNVKTFSAHVKNGEAIPVWRSAWCALPKLCSKQTMQISKSIQNPNVRPSGEFKLPIVGDPITAEHLRYKTVPDVIRFRRVKTGLDRADAMEPVTTRAFTLDEWIELPKDGTFKVLASWNSEPTAGVVIGYVARFGYNASQFPNPIPVKPILGLKVEEEPNIPTSSEIPPEIPTEMLEGVLVPTDSHEPNIEQEESFEQPIEIVEPSESQVDVTEASNETKAIPE